MKIILRFITYLEGKIGHFSNQLRTSASYSQKSTNVETLAPRFCEAEVFRALFGGNSGGGP